MRADRPRSTDSFFIILSTLMSLQEMKILQVSSARLALLSEWIWLNLNNLLIFYRIWSIHRGAETAWADWRPSNLNIQMKFRNQIQHNFSYFGCKFRRLWTMSWFYIEFYCGPPCFHLNRWEFLTLEGDIAFHVYRIDGASRGKDSKATLVPSRRVDSHVCIEEGVVVCTQQATC